MKKHITQSRPNLPTQVIKCQGFYIEKEKISLVKKLETAKQRINQLETKLSNPGFLKNARPDIIKKEKEALTVGEMNLSHSNEFHRPLERSTS
jgi:valyl-tRNA synthetase